MLAPPEATQLSWVGVFIASLIYLVLGIALKLWSVSMKNREENPSRLGFVFTGFLSLMCYLAIVTIISVNLAPDLLVTASNGVATVTGETYTKVFGLPAEVSTVSVILMAIAGIFYVFLAGRLGLITGFAFGIFAIGAMASNAVPLVVGFQDYWFSITSFLIPKA